MSNYIPPSADAVTSSNYYSEWLDELQRHYPNAKIKRRQQQEFKSYFEYNYSSSWLVSRIKTTHFQAALDLTREHFHQCNVIDCGCADGAFLPSLSKYFPHVFAFDYDPKFIESAFYLISKMELRNTVAICNRNMSFPALKAAMPSRKYHIAYVLEVMEHIGQSGQTMYEDKKKFLLGISNLIEEGGIIVITVPKMVGFSFFIQRLGITLLGLGKPPMSFKNFLKSVFLKDASAMEKNWWHNGHLGFNHLKMEKYFLPDFEIIKKKDLLFQAAYIIRRRSPS